MNRCTEPRSPRKEDAEEKLRGGIYRATRLNIGQFQLHIAAS